MNLGKIDQVTDYLRRLASHSDEGTATNLDKIVVFLDDVREYIASEKLKMGQTATVINGLLGEIKQLKGTVADLQNTLGAAQSQPFLDSADIAALDDAQTILSADASSSSSSSSGSVTLPLSGSFSG